LITSLNDLIPELKKDEQVIVNKELNYVAVIKAEEGEYEKTVRLFQINKNNSLSEIPIKIVRQGIIKKLLSKINKDRLLKLLLDERLQQSPPEQLLEIEKRLQKKDAKVTGKKGCVEISIGGFKGQPLAFRLI
jgi:hypothetical protein